MPKPYFPSASVVEAYTDGDCWHLAGVLHKMTGKPIVFVAPEGEPYDEWCHVGILVEPKKILDIEGVKSLYQWGLEWGGDRFTYDVVFDWEEYLTYTEDQFRMYTTNTRRVATRLVETYVPPWGLTSGSGLGTVVLNKETT